MYMVRCVHVHTCTMYVYVYVHVCCTCVCVYILYMYIEDDALKEEIIEMQGVLEEYLAFDNRSEITIKKKVTV